MKHTQPIPRLSGGQLLRQMAVLALILLLWGGGFLLFLNATGAAGVIAVVEITATYTATPAPTPTPTRAASNTPAPTSTRPPTKPAATATSVPTSTAAPTDTSVPIETPTSVATAADVAPAAISFQRDVQPIFNQICVKCHGGEEVKEGLSLKTYAEVMRGSDNGPVIVAGDPANSFLIEQVVNGKMPKQGPKLLPAQIRAITDWVAAGAPNN
jgi:mono/diheme cytochrome c family protein